MGGIGEIPDGGCRERFVRKCLGCRPSDNIICRRRESMSGCARTSKGNVRSEPLENPRSSPPSFQLSSILVDSGRYRDTTTQKVTLLRSNCCQPFNKSFQHISTSVNVKSS